MRIIIIGLIGITLSCNAVKKKHIYSSHDDGYFFSLRLEDESRTIVKMDTYLPIHLLDILVVAYYPI